MPKLIVYKFRVMLLASLFIGFGQSLFAQQYINLFGLNEYAIPGWTYTLDSNILEGYCLVTPKGSASLYDDSSSFYYIKVDAALQNVQTSHLELPDVRPFHFYSFKDIKKGPGYMVASRADLSSAGGGNGVLANCDLCRISPDSLYNCVQLLPDSAYSGGVTGSFLDGDSLILVAHYVYGSKGGGTDFNYYKIAVDTNTFQHTSRLLKYTKGGIDYYPRSDPFKLPNGKWFVQVSRDSAQYSGGMSYAILSESWNALETVIHVGTINNNLFTRSWIVNGKLVFINTEILNIGSWQPSNPIKEQLTLIEYDYLQDTILNRYHFDFSKDTSQLSHHTAGYDAIYNGSHYVISAYRSPDFSAPLPATMVIAVIDSSFNVTGSFTIEDTAGFYTSYIGGAINSITQGATAGEFYYVGYMHDPDMNGNTADIMVGKFDLSKIGLKEQVSLRRQKTWLYPNPSNGNFTLTNTSETFKPYTYSIVDNNGREILKGKAEEPKTFVKANLPAGPYYLLTEEGDVIPFVVK